jgi:hypothetical protein
MKYCGRCGAQLPEQNMKFCPMCGQPFLPEPQGWQQAPGYQAIPRYGSVPHVPDYMGWAIATLILCFWPTGIAAVVYASRVGNRLAMGDVAGAQEASRLAKKWCWVSFIIALVGVVIWIIAVAAIAAAAA